MEQGLSAFCALIDVLINLPTIIMMGPKGGHLVCVHQINHKVKNGFSGEFNKSF